MKRAGPILVLVLIIGVVVGFRYWRTDDGAEDMARDQAVLLTRLAGHDADAVRRQLRDHATGEWASELSTARPAGPKGAVVISSVRVLALAPAGESQDEAVFLVVTAATATPAGKPARSVMRQLVLELERHGGDWQVAKVEVAA